MNERPQLFKNQRPFFSRYPLPLSIKHTSLRPPSTSKDRDCFCNIPIFLRQFL